MKLLPVFSFKRFTICALAGAVAGIALPMAVQASQPVTTAKTSSAAAAKKANSAEPVGNPVRLYEAYVTEKTLAAKAEACIRDKKCPSDEGDFLRHAEAAYKIQGQLAALAKHGNLDAAYIAGLIAYEQARKFDESFRIYAGFGDVEYRKSATKFAELSGRELRKAQGFLLPAAKAMKPEACFLMGEVLEFGRIGEQETGAAPFYYCAAREWHLIGQRELAFRAYSGMLRTDTPQSPMLVEMHAKLLDKQPPNPWRQIQPLSSAPASAPGAGH